MESKFFLQGDKIWRHLAFQFNEDDDMIRFFVDGSLLMEGPSLVPVSEIDIEEAMEISVVGQLFSVAWFPRI